MINFEAALCQNFFQISQRNGIPKIEVHRVQNNVLWKMAAFESDHLGNPSGGLVTVS